MNTFLGVDCGGTHLRVGLVNEAGQLLDSHKSRSPLKDRPEQFGQIVYDQVSKLTKAGDINQIQAIGVGVPGPIDFERGQILVAANLNNTQPINFYTQLKSKFTVPIYFDRDTELALLGESWLGAAKGFKNVIMLTLGTGVGGAIMNNGQLINGESGGAGEIGHAYFEPSAISHQPSAIPVCGLGHQGCLEAWVKHSPIEEIPYYLGTALASLVDIFNPQKFILGGGMMPDITPLIPEITTIMKDKAVKPLVNEVTVAPAKLGDNAGIFGGAYLALIHHLQPTN